MAKKTKTFTEDLFEWGSQKGDSDPNRIIITHAIEKVALTPYDYQLETLEKFKAWFASTSPEALIALTVGLGKTVTAAMCMDYLLSTQPKATILWLTHREELIGQAKETIQSITGLPVDVEKASKRASYSSRIVVASIQSLQKRRLELFAEKFRPTLIVCDEAHHALARTWMEVKSTFFDAKVLNLTATPYRADVSTRLNLGEVLIEKNTTDGIKMGRLVPPKPVGKIEVNLGSVKKALGDYQTSSLSNFLMKEKVLQACTDLFLQHYKGRKSLIFAATVEHGLAIAQKLTDQGVRCKGIYGTTPTAERQAAYEGIQNGDLDALICNLVLTEGWNLPAIDLVCILRPTKNAALFLQMLGRGLRTYPGKKECLVIDVLDTAKRKVAEEGYPLPTDDDRRKAESISGKKLTNANVFLSWFYKREEVAKVASGEKKAEECTKLQTGEQLYALFSRKRLANWLPFQTRAIQELDTLFSNPASLAASDPTGYNTLFRAIRCGNADAFVPLMVRAGWGYYPHHHLPLDAEAFKKDEEAQLVGLNEREEGSFGFSTLISQDASLKNFIVDIFGDETDLAAQAMKYYEVHKVDNMEVVWYKPLKTTIPFSYIEGKVVKNGREIPTFWVRSGITGKIYQFSYGGGFLNQVPLNLRYEYVPPWLRSKAWADIPASNKQQPEIAKILQVDLADIREAKISRLAASALMTGHYKRSYLAKLSNWLEKHDKPLPSAIPASSATH
jgi:superfamily II DNA or RNA helicase